MRFGGPIIIAISFMMLGHGAGARTSSVSIKTRSSVVDVYLSDIPVPHSAFEWNRTSRRLIRSTEAPRKDIKFSIPSSYIVRDSAGKIDVQKSFAKWQASPGVAALNSPITSGGVTYYPYVANNRTYYYPVQELVNNPQPTTVFYTQNQGRLEILKAESVNEMATFGRRWEQQQRAKREAAALTAASGVDEAGSASKPETETPSRGGRTVFFDAAAPDVRAGYGPSRKLSAEELKIRNAELDKNRISSDYTEKIAPEPAFKVPNMSLATTGKIGQDLNQIANMSSLRCNRTNNVAQCMVCNCLGEARGEKDEGQVGVGRVTLTRYAREGYPNTICGVVWQYRAFSWTLTHRDRTFRDPAAIRKCALNMKKSFTLGIWQWDHFYASKGPNKMRRPPTWAPEMEASHGFAQIENHRFLNSGKSIQNNYVMARIQEGEQASSIE
ncbi:MAG: cell wall hydrolase [Bdellovibrionaceae bacterium]|nr:cell wall hydrolase [Pseudobdellovibrionaceae bacterium]